MTQNNLTPPAKNLNVDLFGLPPSPVREQLVALAREVAIDAEDLTVILNRKGITAAQYEKIVKNPFYHRHLQGFIDEYHSILNTEQRVKIKAGWMLEHSLMDVYRRIGDRAEPLSAVVEGVKTLGKLAGIGEKGASGKGDGEKFVISINLGDDKKITEVVDITPAPTGENHDTRTPTVANNGSDYRS